MFDSSEEEYVDSDDAAISRPCAQFDVSQNLTFIDSKPVTVSAGSMRRERMLKRQYVPPGWLCKLVLTNSFDNSFYSFLIIIYSHMIYLSFVCKHVLLRT